MAYIDDVLILTDRIDENLVLLDSVIMLLTDAGFSFKEMHFPYQ